MVGYIQARHWLGVGCLYGMGVFRMQCQGKRLGRGGGRGSGLEQISTKKRWLLLGQQLNTSEVGGGVTGTGSNTGWQLVWQSCAK